MTENTPLFDWTHDTWEFVRAYLKSPNHLIGHHLDTYNKFVRTNVSSIIARANPIRLNFEYDHQKNRYRRQLLIHIERVGFSDPSVRTSDGCRQPITPRDAREHNYTYASNLIADIRIQTVVRLPRQHDNQDVYERRERVISGYHMGDIPVMLKSCICVTRDMSSEQTGECTQDPGGYFIVNGTEKVLVSVERPAENQIMVYSAKHPPSVDIKSIPSGHCVRPRALQLKIVRGALGNDVVRVFIPQVRQNIPLWIVMMALDGGDDKQIMHMLLSGLAPVHVRLQAEQLLRSSIRETSIHSSKESVEFIARHVSSFGGHNTVLTRLTGALRAAHERTRTAIRDGVDAQELTKERNRIDRQKRISYTHIILKREILPHVGPEYYKKRLFIGKMFRELSYGVFTHAANDDRDSFMNKRINAGGALMTQLFSQSYTHLVRDIKNSVNKTFLKGAWRANEDFHTILHADNLYRHIRPSILTKLMRRSLSTGNLGAKDTTHLVGVSQVLGRLSYNGTLSHLRRVIAPLGSSGKLLKPRALHTTHMMAICPAETPEGQPVGLVKNLALAARITTNCSQEPTIHVLLRLGATPITETTIVHIDATPIYVDGDWWGLTHNPESLLGKLRNARRRGDIHPHTSILWIRTHRARSTGSCNGELRICGTGGRIVRPVYRLKDDGSFVATSAHTRFLRAGGTFAALLYPIVAGHRPAHLASAIEYLDIAETNTLMIGMTATSVRKSRPGIRIRYTHCELHPSLMLGVLASLIPFSDHNQSPRNTYQSAMGKQAMGIPTTNFNIRFSTLDHILFYPQRPFVYSRIQNIIPGLADGQNVMVAIAVNAGYNIEDSIIMNETSVERGLMVSTMYKTYRGQEHRTEGTNNRDLFCIPNNGITEGSHIVGTKMGSYDVLGSNGLARVGGVVKNGDIIIGKITPLSGKGSRCHTITSYRDNSVVLKNCTGGIIDRSVIFESKDGDRIARVKIRSTRDASIGDKFSSRHGQKGTVGLLRRHGDMPFTESGVTPDIIMNPHAIPSRMTVGQLVEMYLTKCCAYTGTSGDATPFAGMGPQTLMSFIEAIGTKMSSDEVLHDPITGRRQKCAIFLCPTFYQKLRHIARDKAHARSTGPMVELTRQPTEGRMRGGGLRLGEMERDCILGHGMYRFMRESFGKRSDQYQVSLCNLCGRIAPHNVQYGIQCCHGCTRLHRSTATSSNFEGDWTDISRVNMPYAAKLFIHELMAMNIRVATYTSSRVPPTTFVRIYDHEKSTSHIPKPPKDAPV